MSSNRPPTSPYRLLVFDWDGTLMDSIGTIVSCMAKVQGELALPAHPEAAVRSTIGMGLREVVDTLYPDLGDDDFDAIVACYRRHWIESFREHQLLFAGVEELIGRLADAGYLLAVATGKGRRGLEADFDRTGLRPYFHATRTVDEAATKPSPEMLLSILDELGARRSEALMIGDTVHDLRMAANARVASVAVTSGSQDRDTLAALEPLALLENVLALPAWLDGRGDG